MSIGSQDGTLEPFKTESEIGKLIGELASQINEHYAALVSTESPLLIVVTLKGAALFASDLIRKLKIPIELDFIRVSSYGAETTSSGKVRIHRDLETELNKRHVLILDEIVDTGYTIEFLLKHFGKQTPASVKVCTLLDKSCRREVKVPVDYIGEEVEDKFLVGYGLDYNEKYRNLKDIYFIKSTD